MKPFGSTRLIETFTSIRRRSLKLLALCLALAVVGVRPVSLSAQTSLGQISGTVSDATNSLVHGAQLTITETRTNQTYTATTDEHGFYIVTNLPIGNYTVAVKSTASAVRSVPASSSTPMPRSPVTSNSQSEPSPRRSASPQSPAKPSTPPAASSPTSSTPSRSKNCPSTAATTSSS